MIGAIAIMATAAFTFQGTDLFGQFSDAGGVAHGLKTHGSHELGSLFAIVMLDAALVGANALSLATTYTLGGTFKKRHSLHWKVGEAKLFYVGYAALLAISATITLTTDAHVQGLIVQGVQALAGVLLPSATVFLVLLCNDKPVLGPWAHTVKQNVVAGVIVWVLVLLSLALTTATFFQDSITTTELEIGFAVGAVIGLIGGALVALRSKRTAVVSTGTPSAGTPSTPEALTKADRKAHRTEEQMAWRTPALETLEKPQFSPLRKAGLVTLRGYLLVAVILVIVKIVQLFG